MPRRRNMTDTLSIPLTDEELAELKVRSFTLPLNQMKLLLPSTLIAEVLEYKEVEPAGHMPEWLLGMLQWRGRSVPLFSMEKLLGQEQANRSERTRHVVCNTLSGSPRIPFLAIQIEGMPQLHMVTNEMLAEDKEVMEKQPGVQGRFQLQGEKVLVPDLDAMEKMLEHLGVSAD